MCGEPPPQRARQASRGRQASVWRRRRALPRLYGGAYTKTTSRGHPRRTGTGREPSPPEACPRLREEERYRACEENADGRLSGVYRRHSVTPNSSSQCIWKYSRRACRVCAWVGREGRDSGATTPYFASWQRGHAWAPERLNGPEHQQLPHSTTSASLASYFVTM